MILQESVNRGHAFGATAPLVGRRRLAVRVLLDAGVLAAAFGLAYELRFDFAVPSGYRASGVSALPLVVAVQLASLALAGAYARMWRHVGLADVVAFVWAALVAAIPLLLMRLDLLGGVGRAQTLVPLSVLAIDSGLAFAGVLGLRVARRFLYERSERRRTADGAARGDRVLFIGAGRGGIAALRAIQARGDSAIVPVGFLDDDPATHGLIVQGVPVLGALSELARVVRERSVDQVVITLVEGTRRQVREIARRCAALPVQVRIVPGLLELVRGNVETTIRNVKIEDLLGREPVQLERDHLTPFISGKRVMVTGAGGSIGSELCRQVARLGPERLTLVERCEFALFSIDRELRAAFPGLDIQARLADVGDRGRMSEVFAADRPQIVLHAAAHKHVPLMESNPCEAVKNNIFGTRTTADLAGQFGAELFVLVSTDKAVRPTSVMGATKRLAEQSIKSMAGSYRTHYAAVRFGNVLGSTGSVVPIFREQLAGGGPVTVTHADMVRYFMTIPEAAQLVLHAGAMRKGGEVFVLDMGEPVRIVDLATDMIKRCGLRPNEDVEIVFTGIRPGEKLYEELSTPEEALSPTRHPKIMSGRLVVPHTAEFEQGVELLGALARRGDEAGTRRQLARMLPESQLTLLGGAAASDPVRAKIQGTSAAAA